MTTQVGKLHKRTILKDLRGGIINMRDEANGGWIVRDRQIVNQEKWAEHVQKEKDMQEAMKASANPKIREEYPETKEGVREPDRVDKLEAKVEKMGDTLQAILKAVQK